MFTLNVLIFLRFSRYLLKESNSSAPATNFKHGQVAHSSMHSSANEEILHKDLS